MKEAPRPVGWYLGLRYMQGDGFVANAVAPVEAEQHGARFMFADDILLTAKNWREVIVDWWDALAVGGCLILWVPDCRHMAVGEGLARVTLEQLSGALDDRVGWQMVESDLIDGHAFVVWRKFDNARQWKTPWRKQPKHALVARTGAYGDALMASSVFPEMKARGWTISFLGKRSGVEILRHDPHVDELILLADGQVPDAELPFYWQAWAARFDRFVNLTHSIEGELLKHPDRADYWWSDAQRRALCGRSYLSYIHALADVPGPHRVAFYPGEAERKLAEGFAKRSNGFALWCLRGSAVHKWWPHAPQAICRILARSELDIVLTGGADAAPLADGIMDAVRKYHGDTERVKSCVGTHSIREIMTLAQHARVVVGPETGVMHAVSLERMPKVLLLSHSSRKNLSDDWINTTAIEPNAACHPCHRLHHKHDWCPQDSATGAAVCAASISAARVVDAVLGGLA